MAITNVGDQRIIWKYRTPLKGRYLAQSFASVIEDGVYRGLVASIGPEQAYVLVSPGDIVIKDTLAPDEVTVKIQFGAQVQLPVDEERSRFLVLRYTHVDRNDNFADWTFTSSPLDTDVVVTELVYDATELLIAVDNQAKQRPASLIIRTNATYNKLFPGALPRTVKTAPVRILTEKGVITAAEQQLQLPNGQVVVVFNLTTKTFNQYLISAVPPLFPDSEPIGIVNVLGGMIQNKDITNFTFERMRPQNYSQTPLDKRLVQYSPEGRIKANQPSANNDVVRLIDIATKLDDAPSNNEIWGRRNGQWVTIALSLWTAIEAFKFYSKKTLMVTNRRIVDRRLVGWDLGIKVPSTNSEMFHYDHDLNNQLQQPGSFAITYPGDAPEIVRAADTRSGVLMLPAVSEEPPYEMMGGSLYGNFNGVANLNGLTMVVDFWTKLFDIDNLILFSYGNVQDLITLSILGVDPPLSTVALPDPDLYTGSLDGIPLYVIGTQGGNILHSWQGGSETIDLDDEGVEIGEREWIHLAILISATQFVVVINNAVISINRQNTTQNLGTFTFNQNNALVSLDELMIDQTVSVDPAAVVANTIAKIPYAALSYLDKWFILEAQDPELIKTNLFDGSLFAEKVNAVISP